MYKRIELNCGLDLVREVLNGKWKIHLLYFISEGAKRPGDLQRNAMVRNRKEPENPYFAVVAATFEKAIT